ncbi:MAG: ComF family protein [Elusimicrobia bacterium CG_4_10_14_3_um_filter_49_12_50_7]|nr:MAG: ComF family protein [Elusimicrobia bacterium CG_4_10_14_3_um_filter_49_12_50_7]
MLRHIVNFIFPPRCSGCGALLPLSSKELICGECTDEISSYELPPVEYSDCVLISSALYRGAAKNLIKEMKFRNVRSCARIAARVMTDSLIKHDESFIPEMIIPVPLHSSRKNERGYNQSSLIAAGVSTLLKIPFSASKLRRIRNTPSQRGLSPAERVKNVKGAFKARGKIPANILLIDDVATTGATLNECAATLLSSGARRVLALTFAKT